MEGKATAWERLTRIDVRIWDGLLAAAALVNAQLDLWLARDTGPGVREPDLLAAALLVVATVPLYERRRRPVAVAIVVAAAVLAFGAISHPATETLLPLAVAAYSVAAYQRRSAGQTIAITALLVASAVSWSDANPNWVEMASNAFFTVGLPFAIGRIVWNRRRRLDREREVATRDAVALERSRIARELHDVVAHSMSVMVVQAGAARAVLRKDPDETERALNAIEESGRAGSRRDAPAPGRRWRGRAVPRRRNRDWNGSTSCWAGCARRDWRWSWSSKATSGRSRRASICPPIASSRRRSRTR